VLDALSAQRRDLEDSLGLEGELFGAVAGGPATIDACFGRVRLDSGGGDERWRSIRWLAHHRDCQAVPAAAKEEAAGPRRQPATLDDLTDYQREVVRLRAAHVPETETGFRGAAAPGSRGAPSGVRPAGHDAGPAAAGQGRRAEGPRHPPPADAAASAGLAYIADRVLGGSTGDVREFLRQFLPPSPRKANRTYWGVRVLRSEIPCSEGMQAACDPIPRNFTRPPRGRRNAVLRPERWEPENIPAFLPADWYARHFTPIAGVNPMFIRRTAALRLVQMAAGGSLGEAAGFLGIASTDTTWENKARIYSGAGFVHTGASRQPDPRSFETALISLARELDSPATPLINYQRRRHALQTWCIDGDTWDQLIGRLPPVPGPHQPELGDRKRQIASIYVWAQVTSGEHYFAPRPIEAAQPHEIQEDWKGRWNNILHLIRRDRPSPHYTNLRTKLDTLAASLAASIDANRR
jgi:hypothetical protein